MRATSLGASLAIAALLLAGSVATATAAEKVPIHGSEVGQVFITGTPDPKVPTVVSVTYTAEGVASHLGRYQFIGHNLADFVTGCTLDGEFTIDTASGDRLFGTYDLCFDPTISFYTETLWITGGTGRFEGASGTLHSDGIYTSRPPDPILFTATWDGTISTPGSSRR